MSDNSDDDNKAKRQAQKQSIYNRAPSIDVESAGEIKPKQNLEHAKGLLALATRSFKKKLTFKKPTV